MGTHRRVQIIGNLSRFLNTEFRHHQLLSAVLDSESRHRALAATLITTEGYNPCTAPVQLEARSQSQHSTLFRYEPIYHPLPKLVRLKLEQVSFTASSILTLKMKYALYDHYPIYAVCDTIAELQRCSEVKSILTLLLRRLRFRPYSGPSQPGRRILHAMTNTVAAAVLQ